MANKPGSARLIHPVVGAKSLELSLSRQNWLFYKLSQSEEEDRGTARSPQAGFAALTASSTLFKMVKKIRPTNTQRQMKDAVRLIGGATHRFLSASGENRETSLTRGSPWPRLQAQASSLKNERLKLLSSLHFESKNCLYQGNFRREREKKAEIPAWHTNDKSGFVQECTKHPKTKKGKGTRRQKRPK